MSTVEDRLFVRDIDGWSRLCSRDYHSEHQLKVFEIENGLILPARKHTSITYEGGVCTEDFKFIAGFLRNGKTDLAHPGYYGIGASYNVSDKEMDLLNEELIFGGYW